MEKIETMETKLCKRVMRGDCEGVKELLINNIEILRGVTPQGDSAMHVAAVRGHHEMVKLLVSLMPCVLLTPNINQETPLHAAARSGTSKVVDVLLNENIGLQCNCNSPLCPRRINLEASPMDLQEIWKARNKKGETALHYAIKRNCVEVSKQLLNKVQGIEFIENNEGESPLYTACYYGFLEIGKMLLEDPAIRDTRNDGRSCLHQAIINILEWSDEGEDKKWHDCAVDLASALLDKRPQLAEAMDSSGNSPLHLLVALQNSRYSNFKLVTALLEARPNINFVLNKDGMGPIHIAAGQGGGLMIIKLLDLAPLCSYMLSKRKKNALHFALEHNHDASLFLKVHFLLELSVDKGFLVNEPDNEGKTALSIASEALAEPLKSTILQKMLGTSNPGPNFFRKRNTREVSKGERSKENVEDKDPKERLSVIAALIATITFAAGFTIPGGLNPTDGSPVLMHEAPFKIFIFFDSLALSLSIMSLLQLIYRPSTGVTGVYTLIYRMPEFPRRPGEDFEVWKVRVDKDFEKELARWGRRYLRWSLNAMMVAFAAGIYVVVASKCHRLAVTVCVLTLSGLLLDSILPFILRIPSYRLSYEFPFFFCWRWCRRFNFIVSNV